MQLIGPGLFTSVGALADGSKVYVTNSGDNTVSVIDTATNTVTATIPVEVVCGGIFGVAVSSEGLCRERLWDPGWDRDAQHRVGDRHCDQHGDRHDPGRGTARLRHCCHPGRQQGLCHEPRRDCDAGDRYGVSGAAAPR
jgi:YVTN family beta-propeller protein